MAAVPTPMAQAPIGALPHVLIVGGGFGGLAAARALAGAPVRVTLVDARNHHLFQPLLYQVATASLAPADIAEPLRGVLAAAPRVEVRLGEVVDVDLAGRRARLADGAELGWDKLIVAAGARTSWFGRADWERAAPGLKSLDDALHLRRRMLEAFERAEWTDDPAERQRLLTFVVVGAGPTGVELAGALREIACRTLTGDFRHVRPERTRVLLVEAGPRVLPGLPPALSAAAARALVELGVELRVGARVEDVAEDRVVISGEAVPAGLTIWAAGVRGAPIGERLGAPVDRGGRVPVGPDCSLPGHPDVFVIGDLALFAGPGGAPLPGVAPVAIGQGAHAARCVRDDLAGRPRRPFVYADRGAMATIGWRRAVAQLGRLELSGTAAWLIWVFVHLMALVGHRSRAAVLTRWAWAWATWQGSSRLILGDPGSRPG